MIEIRQLHTNTGLCIVVKLQYRYLNIGIGKDGNICTPEWSDWIDVKDVYVDD